MCASTAPATSTKGPELELKLESFEGFFLNEPATAS
jgi:hypothetical protein